MAGTLSRFCFILSFGKAQTTHPPPQIFRPWLMSRRPHERSHWGGRLVFPAPWAAALPVHPWGSWSGYVGTLGKLLRLQLEPGYAANALEPWPALDWSFILCPIPSPEV